MSNFIPPPQYPLANGTVADADDFNASVEATQRSINGDLGNANITSDPTQKIAYAKLALALAILDSDIVSVAAAKISTLKAAQQATPNNTVLVAAGKYISLDAQSLKSFAGGNSPAFPSTGGAGLNRIDVLTINDAGTLERAAGSEAASPAPPAYPADKLPICEVYVRYNAGGVIIRDTDNGSDSYIRADARPLLSYPGLADGTVTRSKLFFGGATGIVTASGATDLSDPGTSFVDMTDMATGDLLMAGSGSWGIENRVRIELNGAIELKQADLATHLPMAEIRLMHTYNGGTYAEIKRIAVDLRAFKTVGGFGDSGITNNVPIVIPVHLSLTETCLIGDSMGFKVQWSRTNGATPGTPTIRQPGVTYKRTLSVSWFNKPAFS